MVLSRRLSVGAPQQLLRPVGPLLLPGFPCVPQAVGSVNSDSKRRLLLVRQMPQPDFSAARQLSSLPVPRLERKLTPVTKELEIG